MKIAKLYVGANNQTKKVEMQKLLDTLSILVDGATIEKSQGIWKGIKEQSVIVTLVGGYDLMGITVIAGTLNTALNQDAIMVELDNQAHFISDRI